MTPLVSEQNQVLTRFGIAIRSHQLDLHLSTNHIESIVECFAKSADAEVKQHLPELSLAISNLRECLSKLQIQWWMFENWHEHDNYTVILLKPMLATPGDPHGKSRCGNRPLYASQGQNRKQPHKCSASCAVRFSIRNSLGCGAFTWSDA